MRVRVSERVRGSERVRARERMRVRESVRDVLTLSIDLTLSLTPRRDRHKGGSGGRSPPEISREVWGAGATQETPGSLGGGASE